MSEHNTCNIDKILELIPHRYPFVFVDKVVDYVAKQSIRAVKNLSINESFFQGHFPQKPIMPGVLMMEAVAQAAGLLLMLEGENKGKMFFLAGVDKARFRRFAQPGDQLVLHAKHTKSKKMLHFFDCWIEVEEKKIMDATILLVEGGIDG
jgi:3-hydroxyacyl-[acyl-carrier-protein] dehydratase